MGLDRAGLPVDRACGLGPLALDRPLAAAAHAMPARAAHRGLGAHYQQHHVAAGAAYGLPLEPPHAARHRHGRPARGGREEGRMGGDGVMLGLGLGMGGLGGLGGGLDDGCGDGDGDGDAGGAGAYGRWSPVPALWN